VQEEALRHGKLTNETLAREIERTEKIISVMDTFLKASLTELKKEVLTAYTEQQNWQLTFEDA